MHYTQLSNRVLIGLTGTDTSDLLQGIVSNDVRPVFEGTAVYTALLSPQGKFLHDFFMLPYNGGVAIDIHIDRAPDLLQRLKMYKLRSQVDIVRLEDISVFAVWGEGVLSAPPNGIVLQSDPRLPAMGWRVIGEVAAVNEWLFGLKVLNVDEAAYEQHRLEKAMPEGGSDMIVDKSLLLEFGFESLHGVDFAKGCYVGQEVTARSKYRGQVRKSVYSVCIAGQLPARGTKVVAQGKEIGELRSVLGGIGLAILNIEEVDKAKAASQHLMAGDVAIDVALPTWLHREEVTPS